MWSSARRVAVLGLSAAVVAWIAACSSSAPARPASTRPASARPASAGRTTGAPSPAQSCAWPYMVSVATDNNAVPDSAALYWGQPIVAGPGTRIVLSGRFPDARYASLSVYTPSGNPFTSGGTSSSLPDYRIAAEPGSVNPWQHPARPGVRFQVTIAAGAASGGLNTLPMPPGTSTEHPGYLVYRVYLPAGGISSHVPLPAIAIDSGQTARSLPPCRVHVGAEPPSERAPGASGPAAGNAGLAAPLAPAEFYVPAFGGGLANADTAYVAAYLIRPPAPDVVVITGKAPTFPSGNHPSPWPQAGKDMRYWSICTGVGIAHLPTVANALPGGRADYGCRADEATALNSAGEYAYVIGSEAQRNVIDSVPGATFLPFSASQPARLYFLLLRNTLVSPQFTHSVQNVTRTLSPAAAAAAMGPYYPRVFVCALRALVARGLHACDHPAATR
jgi:hypothetical protein